MASVSPALRARPGMPMSSGSFLPSPRQPEPATQPCSGVTVPALMVKARLIPLMLVVGQSVRSGLVLTGAYAVGVALPSSVKVCALPAVLSTTLTSSKAPPSLLRSTLYFAAPSLADHETLMELGPPRALHEVEASRLEADGTVSPAVPEPSPWLAT